MALQGGMPLDGFRGRSTHPTRSCCTASLKDRGDLLIGRKSTRAHVCQTSVNASALVLAQLVGASAASANLARILRKFLLILKLPRLHFVEQLFCQCRHNMNLVRRMG